MEATWYFLIAMMLTTYAVLDGFDFGAGILHLVVAKTDAERRDRHGHGRQDADDRDYRDQFGNGESGGRGTGAHHSTLAWPPAMVAATMAPLPFFRSGLSRTI